MDGKLFFFFVPIFIASNGDTPVKILNGK